MNIFIGASSSVKEQEYIDLARDVSMSLSDNYDLVCGGIASSMLKEIFINFKNKGKNTSCVTLEFYHEDLSTVNAVTLVDTTLERLNVIYEMTDIFLFLPGGTGTISEMFGILEELRTKQDNKRMIIYNYNGYYNSIINTINMAINNGFNNSSICDNIRVVDSLEDLNILLDCKEKTV